MNNTYQNKIARQFASFFTDNKNSCILNYGIECGTGWYLVILKYMYYIKKYSLPIKITRIHKRNNRLVIDYNAKRITKKLNKQMKLIELCIDEESYLTCEACGFKISESERINRCSTLCDICRR